MPAVREPQLMLPRTKHDVERAAALIGLGYPAVAPVLDEMLGWTIDGNWPVALPLARFLFRLGPPIVAPVRLILRGDDAEAKWHCLSHIVAFMDHETARNLRADLVRLAEAPSAGDVRAEVDRMARDALEWMEGGA